MVMRVKVSPAREPKALEPPEPPKAPAKPPPLPFWINTRRIRNIPTSSKTIFKSGGSQDQTAQMPMYALLKMIGSQDEAFVSRRGSPNPSWQINRHYRLPPRRGKVDFDA